MPAAPSDMRDPNRQRPIPDMASPELGMPGLGDEVSPEPIHVTPSQSVKAAEEDDEHAINHPAPRDQAFDEEAERVRVANARLGSHGNYIACKRGLHPLIDAWIAAEESRKDPAVLLALAALQADPEAMKIAERFVPYHTKKFKWLDAAGNDETPERQQPGNTGRSPDLMRDRGRDITDT